MGKMSKNIQRASFRTSKKLGHLNNTDNMGLCTCNRLMVKQWKREKSKRRALNLVQTLKKKQQQEEGRQKTIEAMAIADKKATVKGHSVFGKFVLQMRPDKDKMTKETHAFHQRQMRKQLKISCAKMASSC